MPSKTGTVDEYIARAPGEKAARLELVRTTVLSVAPQAEELIAWGLPEWVRGAIDEAGLAEAYDARPPYQRNDYVGWIVRPKREATRQAHLDQMLDELRQGDVYMRMPWRAGS